MQRKHFSKNFWQKSFAGLLTSFSQNKQYILYKFLPTSLMLLFSAYINSFLRAAKDSVLVPTLGAELISFIKFYGVFPSTVIFFICFTKLANILSRDKLYYGIISTFVGFFLLYAFVLNPFQSYLEPDLSAWLIKFPMLKYQILMIQHWIISLLYIMCEIFGTVVLTLLFWQFANELYTIKEAKQTYALFGVIGQSGIIVAGYVQLAISNSFANYGTKQMIWDITLKWMMVSILIAGIILMLLYRWIYKNVFFNPELCTRKRSGEREKLRLSVKESMKYVFSSRYLWLIMMIVFCYGVGVNLIETTWKHQLKLQYTSNHSYSAFMGKFNICFGLASMTVMLFGTYILRKFQWLVSALMTPIGAGISGSIFFTLLIYKDLFETILTSMGTNVLMMAAMLGSAQVILFKSLNYTFVDSTKEMAFMPLDRELRTKGKAAVDVIGSRFGKACGAVAQQLMFQFISPSISNLTEEIFIFFVSIMTIWTLCVISLNHRFLQIAEKAEH